MAKSITVTRNKEFAFLKMNEPLPKPRTRGVTEIRGPYYTPMGKHYLRDLLETMGFYADTLKFAGALQQDTAGTAQAIGGLASRLQKFVRGLTSYPAGALVSSSPTSSYQAAYLSSTASAPWWQGGVGGFSLLA